jgi:hypothetical protein
MRTRTKSEPRERTVAEHLVYGNLLAATPGLRALARQTKADLETSLSEEQARQRLRARLESQGLTLRKMLLPSVSRKLLRVSLRKLLHALADLIADKSESKRFGTALDTLLGKFGVDQWLEDYVFAYAAQGEVLPIFRGYAGAVQVLEVGPLGDKSPLVWLVATPASDVDALISEFKEAVTVFPDETFTKRHGKAVKGATYYRMNQEGKSYSEIAHENIFDLYPELCASDDNGEFAFYTKLVERETKRVEKLALRTAERGDRILDYKSPVRE